MKFWIAMMLGVAATLSAEVKVHKLDLKPDAASRKAYFAQSIRLWGSQNFMPNPNQRLTIATLSNAKASFTLLIYNTKKPDGKMVCSVGMVRPSTANWYANSFFTFEERGIKSENAELKVKNMAGGAEVGELTLEFVGDKLGGILKFNLLNDDDKLLLSFTPNQKAGTNFTHCWVNLICYPSSFGGSWAAGLKLRKREALLPSGTFVANNKWRKCAATDAWILFYDKYFDVGANRGEGPCAVAFNPKQFVQSYFLIGNYGCNAKFQVPMNKTATMIIWDFHGWTNKNAQEFMKKLEIAF